MSNAFWLAGAPLVVILILLATTVRARVAAPLMTAVVMAYLTFVLGYFLVMGTPKAPQHERARPAVARVVWAAPQPGKAIYVLLTWEGQLEPRYYVLPWSEATGRQLTGALAKAKATGRPVMMRAPFGGGAGKGAKQGEGEGDGDGTPGPAGGQRPQGAEYDGLAPGAVFYAPPPAALPDKYQDPG